MKNRKIKTMRFWHFFNSICFTSFCPIRARPVWLPKPQELLSSSDERNFFRPLNVVIDLFTLAYRYCNVCLLSNKNQITPCTFWFVLLCSVFKGLFLTAEALFLYLFRQLLYLIMSSTNCQQLSKIFFSSEEKSFNRTRNNLSFILAECNWKLPFF